MAAKPKRDAISLGKLKIRNYFGGLGRQPQCAGVSFSVEVREPREIGAPLRDNFVGRRICLKEPRFAVLIERHKRSHQSGDARVPGERSVLCLRQLQPGLQATRRCCQAHAGACACMDAVIIR
jgi:hypothetical protein